MVVNPKNIGPPWYMYTLHSVLGLAGLAGAVALGIRVSREPAAPKKFI